LKEEAYDDSRRMKNPALVSPEVEIESFDPIKVESEGFLDFVQYRYGKDSHNRVVEFLNTPEGKVHLSICKDRKKVVIGAPFRLLLRVLPETFDSD
jgi:hypothetical protein